jgi:tripartite ATP-independent transporter DctP family solute receptor
MNKKLGLVLSSTLSLSVFLTACGGTSNTSAPKTSSGTTSGSNTASAPAASTGDKIVLKLGHTLAPDSHYQLAAQKFADIVKEKSNGKIEVQIFPQSQLGGEVQMAQALKTGTQDMEISAQAPITNSIKEWGIFDLPYLFDNLEQANKVMQGPVGKKYLDMLDKQNIVGLAWISVAERDVFTGKKPVKTLDDLKSLKLRVMQSPGYVNGYKALGANPTPMAYSEVYLALQQGLVDGGDTSPDQLVQDKFTEVTKYFSLTHVNYLPVVLAIGKTSWNKLTPVLQNVVRDAAKQAAEFDIQTYKKQYDESIDAMKKKGVEVIQVDTKPWAQATDSVRTDLLSKIPNGEALYKEIQDAKK